MNIFVLDESPLRAARYHCDKHVVKMILETAQLLSNAHHAVAAEPLGAGFYKPTHAKHPCAIWVCASDSNYDWSWRLGLALCEQYTLRYGKTHACESMFSGVLAQLPVALPHAQQTPHPQCMPDVYRGPDAVQAYRRYYAGDKWLMVKWAKQTPEPYWFRQYMEEVDERK